MAGAPEPSLDDHLWTIAVARLCCRRTCRVQAPPNLAHERLPAAARGGHRRLGRRLARHARPRQPRGARGPTLDRLAAATAAAGLTLAAAPGRLPALPARPERWLAPRTSRGRAAPGRRRSASRAATRWSAGRDAASRRAAGATRRGGRLARRSPTALDDGASAAASSARPTPPRCSAARGPEVALLARRRRRLRARASTATRSRTSSAGTSTTRTSATSAAASARSRRAAWPRTCAARPTCSASTRSCAAAQEAWERGATEVCLQGGIHPASRGELVPDRARGHQGRAAATCTCTPSRRSRSGRAPPPRAGRCARYLERLRDAGLGSLPGTAAEILDDEVRRVLCPDKVSTAQWLEVMRTAHERRPALDVDDHVRPRRGAREPGAPPARAARPAARDRRLHRVRAAAVRARRGADLPQGPRAGGADVRARRSRCTPRRASPASATSPNIQASWVKLGPEGARSAARRRRQRPRRHAHERVDQPRGRRRARPGMPARAHGRRDPRRGPRRVQRTTLYGRPPAERVAASFGAPPLAETPTPAYDDQGLERPKLLIRPGLRSGGVAHSASRRSRNARSASLSASASAAR